MIAARDGDSGYDDDDEASDEPDVDDGEGRYDWDDDGLDDDNSDHDDDSMPPADGRFKR
jgi:hypothetical protein